jgi:hypothetical protein
MTISQTPEEIKAAFALQSKCELKRISLRQCHASLEGAEGVLKHPLFLKVVSHSAVANPVTSGTLRIEGRFHFQGCDSSPEPVTVFSAECVFELDYQLQDESFKPAQDSLAAFKDGNAIFNCWPYAREFVNDLTSRMELRTHPLPFLRIVPKNPQPPLQPKTPPSGEVAEPARQD